MIFSVEKARSAYRWIKATTACTNKEAPIGIIKRFSLYAPVGLRICISYPKSSIATAKQTPHNFKLTDFETALPLHSESVGLYYSFFPYFLATFLILKDHETVKKGLRGMSALVDISHAIYQQYPGKYPFGPKEAHLSWHKPADLALRLYYAVDPRRNNVFPSLHVGMTAFIGLVLLHGGYERAAHVMLRWSALISASTLAVKQHFQVDIIAAWVLASRVHYFFLETNQTNAAAMAAIKDETLMACKNLIAGNYSPPLENNASPAFHIHPAIFAGAEQVEGIESINPIYWEILKSTLALTK
ncbi:MAG: phosphatase PAP2 family protein [Candidatus Margulisiibacteriota bacterium]